MPPLNSSVRPLMHPCTMLKQILQDLGAEPTSEDLRPDVFGSYMANYDNAGEAIRLIWDGKDGWGFVQQRRSDGDWVDASEFLTERDLKGLPQSHEKIARFREAVAALLR